MRHFNMLFQGSASSHLGDGVRERREERFAREAAAAAAETVDMRVCALTGDLRATTKMEMEIELEIERRQDFMRRVRRQPPLRR